MSVDNLPEPRQPGRGYVWAPFAPGNDAAATHGAYSERHLSPIVDELLELVTKHAPWCAAPVFEPARVSWAWAQAQAILYRRWFNDHGLGLDDEDQPASIDKWHRAEARASKLADELGFTPPSLTKLLRNLSAIDGPAATSGLDALKAAGAEIRQAADQAAIPATTGDQAEGGASDAA